MSNQDTSDFFHDSGRVRHHAENQRIFPIDLPVNKWIQFDAEGFSEPACGVIYHAYANRKFQDQPTHGMPIGTIDTGCIDIELDGTFGYSTIFNTHVPRRTLNLPFLGISVGERTWVLSRPPHDLWNRMCKHGTEKMPSTPSDIFYWGHYPVVNLEYELKVSGRGHTRTPAPVSVGLRAWSSFLPGNVETSLIPGGVFEVSLRNATDCVQRGTIVFSFPGPSSEEAEGVSEFEREKQEGAFSGISVTNGGDIGYALGVANIPAETTLRFGAALDVDGAAWANIGDSLPEVEVHNPGTSIAVDFLLAPRESKKVRYILSWYSPRWSAGGTPMSGGNTYSHMYATRYANALDAAQVLAKNHGPLLKRILAWQETIYTDNKLPVWLRESLVNILYLITKDGLWACAEPPVGQWCRPEDGLFGMNEDPRGCPQIECHPCSFLGNLPLVYFFPELALSTLRGYKAYQHPDGPMAWIWNDDGSGPCDMTSPGYRPNQRPHLAMEYVIMIDRLILATQDAALLEEFYPSVKKAVIHNIKQVDELGVAGPGRIISVLESPAGIAQDDFETCQFFGMAVHLGGMRLAMLKIMERMSVQVGDEIFAKRCREWFIEGSRAMETEMWTGTYYLNYYDPQSGQKSDLIFGYQLDGEWVARFHGLSDIFRSDRVNTVLETVKGANVALSRYGATNFATVDGSIAAEVGYGPYSMFPPHLLMLAMTYMYSGEVKFGLELARRHWHNIICEKGCAWDAPNTLRGDKDTGDFSIGHDYYQNMILWSLPAAIESRDLRGPTASGSVVDRVIKAACSE